MRVYETIAANGSTYTFEDDGQSWVSVSVNGDEWGVPQGCRFIRALLDDIEKLKNELTSIKNGIEK